MSAKLVCLVMGVVFVIVGIWGFITPGRVLIFHVNTPHNLVHLFSGAAAIVCGLATPAIARGFCLGFGLVYAMVALLGFVGVRWIVDLLALNAADNWLHTVIAAVFLIAAAAPVRIATRPEPGPPRAPPTGTIRPA